MRISVKQSLRVAAVLSILSLSSCMASFKAYENRAVTDELIGMHQSEIIEYLGAPADIVTYQNGSILVYEGNEVAFVYNHARRKIANPKLEVYCDNDDICTTTRVSQLEKVKKFSVGKTVFFVLALGLIGAAL